MSEERFDRIDQRLDHVDGRLGGVEQRLDRVDGRLDGIDGRLDGLDGRLGRVDGRLGSLRTEVNDLGNAVVDLGRQMRVLHEDVIANIKATPSHSGPTRVEFDEFRETTNSRLGPIEAAVRVNSLDIEALKQRDKQ